VLVRAWCRWVTRSAFIRYACSSLLQAFCPLVDPSLMYGTCSILCKHPAMDFRRLTPFAHRKRTTVCFFLIVQSLCGAAILLPSLLSAMWLNDGMLRAASYMSSLAHIWCCAFAPLSCFYRAILKLALLSDSPTYVRNTSERNMSIEWTVWLTTYLLSLSPSPFYNETHSHHGRRVELKLQK
jgi:hypothetical protein